MLVLPILRFYSHGKKIVFLSVVTPCTLWERYQHFGGTYSLHLQPIYAEDGGSMLLLHLHSLWYSEHAGSMSLLHSIPYIVDCVPAHFIADSPEYSLIIISLCLKCQVSHLRMCCVQHWHRRTFRFHGTHLQWKAAMELSWVTKCHISPLKNGMVGNFIALTLSSQKPIPHWLPVQVMLCLCLLLLWNLALCGFMLDCCVKKHCNWNTWIQCERGGNVFFCRFLFMRSGFQWGKVKRFITN